MNRIIFFFVLCTLVLNVSLLAQKRYLVTPNNRAIPLNHHESARTVMTNLMSSRPQKSPNGELTSSYGYPPSTFPPTDVIGANRKDVLAMWFVAPVSGTIDTIFWLAGSVGALDSILYVRIDQSFIGPHSGPGNGYPLPCEGWGFWRNTNDIDQGIGAFPDDATDTTWFSNVAAGPWGSTFPPVGDNLWGFTGFPAIDHADKINSVAMTDLDTLHVNACDTFWISMRVKSALFGDTLHPTYWWATRTNAPFPSRVWRFYEHPSASLESACDGGSYSMGWYAYGGLYYDSTGFHRDSTQGIVLNWWYVMTVDTTFELTDSVDQDWNMVSVPVLVRDYRKSSVYRKASSSAFTYQGSYQKRDTLENGAGYWVKFASPDSVQYFGTSLMRETVNVRNNWNMIGSISCPIAVSSITSSPGGMVTSPFFGYSGAYSPSDIILPGRAYWVRVNQDGKLILSALASNTPANRIRITSSSESPPRPPDRDVPNSLKALPSKFGLDQNSPNPFNPSTLIRFALPVESHVTLKIYNTMGQTVATLVEGDQDAGYKSVQWDASNDASGIYFYQIEATSIGDPGNSFRQVKKMVLVR